MMLRAAIQHTVGIAAMQVSNDADASLVTYALGSCLGVSVHDPVARVGGLLHVMLPQSTLDPAKAAANPCMFVDTGVPLLFRSCYQAGAKKERIQVTVAGGASVHSDPDADRFQIGKRNFLMLRQLFWKNGVLIRAQDVGGQISRTMRLDVARGEVRIRSNGVETIL